MEGTGHRCKMARDRNLSSELPDIQKKNVLKVWVPQLLEMSLEELCVADVQDEGKQVALPGDEAEKMLRGVGGGVTPGKFATAALGGPARLDQCEDMFQPGPSQLGLAAQPQSHRPAAPSHASSFDPPVRKQSLPSLSPGPSASAVGGDEDTSEAESAVEAPKQIEATTSSRSVGSATKRAAVSEAPDDDKTSAVSSGKDSKATRVTKKAKSSKKVAIEATLTFDIEEYPATITKPLMMSEFRHNAVDFLTAHIDSFEV